MLKEIKFNELRFYVASWEENKKSPEVSYGLLMCIGYLRRESLNKEELYLLREVECMVKNSLSSLAEGYKVFMQHSYLKEYAKDLLKEREEDSITQFFQLRDESQIAFEIFEEYSEEKNFPSPILKEIRHFLVEVDHLVIWDKRLVHCIQGQFFSEEAPVGIDKEFYWWWNYQEKNTSCWVPEYLKDSWISASIDNVLELAQEELLHQHLDICEECSKHYQYLVLLKTSENQEKDFFFESESHYFIWSIPFEEFLPVEGKYTLTTSSPQKEEIEIELAEGKIYGTILKESGEIICRIASKTKEFRGLKLLISMGDIQQEAVLEFSVNEILRAFPIQKDGRPGQSPEIIFSKKQHECFISGLFQIRKISES